MGDAHWRELHREPIHSAYGRGADRVTFAMPDGREEVYHLADEYAAAAVVALTTDQRIVLTRQFRPGPRTVLYELPGGVVDPGESPQDAAARELAEETGYRGDVRLVTATWHDAYSNGVRYACVATGCTPTARLAHERNEFIEVVLMELEEFRSTVLRRGRLTDVGPAYLGLDHLGLL
ncbi:NUDIX hydrolase [Kitasatospora sp. NPDC001527]|uniref:NUDIX hydrolase n=1 Tax=Kitasatospora sp. NPDC001527 TaxID=3154519 RepID=UPI00332AAB3C